MEEGEGESPRDQRDLEKDLENSCEAWDKYLRPWEGVGRTEETALGNHDELWNSLSEVKLQMNGEQSCLAIPHPYTHKKKGERNKK